MLLPGAGGRPALLLWGDVGAAPVSPQVLSMKKELNPVELDFLLRFPFKAGALSPVDFLQHQGWGGIKVGCGPQHCVPSLPPSPWCSRWGRDVYKADIQGNGAGGAPRRRGRGAEGYLPARRKLYFPV